MKQPPTAVETVQVSAPGSASSSTRSSTRSSTSENSTSTVGDGGPAGNGLGGGASSVPVGPLPDLNNAGSSLIDAGNAAGLFPQISPSDSPSPAPGPGSRAGNAKADPTVSLLPLGMPVVTAQVVGLIALAIALMLAMTRISLRRRPGNPTAPGPGPRTSSPSTSSRGPHR